MEESLNPRFLNPIEGNQAENRLQALDHSAIAHQQQQLHQQFLQQQQAFQVPPYQPQLPQTSTPPRDDDLQFVIPPPFIVPPAPDPSHVPTGPEASNLFLPVVGLFDWRFTGHPDSQQPVFLGPDGDVTADEYLKNMQKWQNIALQNMSQAGVQLTEAQGGSSSLVPGLYGGGPVLGVSPRPSPDSNRLGVRNRDELSDVSHENQNSMDLSGSHVKSPAPDSDPDHQTTDFAAHDAAVLGMNGNRPPLLNPHQQQRIREFGSTINLGLGEQDAKANPQISPIPLPKHDVNTQGAAGVLAGLATSMNMNAHAPVIPVSTAQSQSQAQSGVSDVKSTVQSHVQSGLSASATTTTNPGQVTPVPVKQGGNINTSTSLTGTQDAVKATIPVPVSGSDSGAPLLATGTTIITATPATASSTVASQGVNVSMSVGMSGGIRSALGKVGLEVESNPPLQPQVSASVFSAAPATATATTSQTQSTGVGVGGSTLQSGMSALSMGADQGSEQQQMLQKQQQQLQQQFQRNSRIIGPAGEPIERYIMEVPAGPIAFAPIPFEPTTLFPGMMATAPPAASMDSMNRHQLQRQHQQYQRQVLAQHQQHMAQARAQAQAYRSVPSASEIQERTQNTPRGRGHTQGGYGYLPHTSGLSAYGQVGGSAGVGVKVTRGQAQGHGEAQGQDQDSGGGVGVSGGVTVSHVSSGRGRGARAHAHAGSAAAPAHRAPKPNVKKRINDSLSVITTAAKETHTQPQPQMQQQGRAQGHVRGNNKFLPEESVAVLKQWLVDRVSEPYPTEKEKRELSQRSGLTQTQVNNWFVNARRRILKPKAGIDWSASHKSKKTFVVKNERAMKRLAPGRQRKGYKAMLEDDTM